ncbi:dihydropteroate synthase [uncultured Thiocystis sp.]|uniref:dihydropteroate synthase n=1 Tax=uncultured Thiocystis sp. TaxID=1202134 RepID=UPI0025E77CA7|nr:dihydropteroate synthase [uncultured Thiocystis sp.]
MNTYLAPAEDVQVDSPPRIMGILNLTPDSFSDGGRYSDPDAAVAQGLSMLEQGADLIDVGGESTRPGARPVPAAEQERRVLDVIRRLHERMPAAVPISIDTASAQVARAALAAGASWINDTSAGCDDPRMLPLAAESGAPIVLMHRQGRPRDMQDSPSYVDVVREVREVLAARADAALASGIREDRILLDPGIGFGKRLEDNLALLAGLPELVALGFPILLGTSRKRFMATLCGGLDPSALMPATCATTAIGVMAGVQVFRVHDVAGNRQAADLAWAIRHAV